MNWFRSEILVGVITTGPKKNSGLKVKVGMKMLLTDYKKNRVKVI